MMKLYNSTNNEALKNWLDSIINEPTDFEFKQKEDLHISFQLISQFDKTLLKMRKDFEYILKGDVAKDDNSTHLSQQTINPTNNRRSSKKKTKLALLEIDLARELILDSVEIKKRLDAKYSPEDVNKIMLRVYLVTIDELPDVFRRVTNALRYSDNLNLKSDYPAIEIMEELTHLAKEAKSNTSES